MKTCYTTLFNACCLLGALFIAPTGHAAQTCDKDLYGQVYCAPEGGVLQKDAFGKYTCSPGSCLRDDHGRQMCSAQIGGAVVMDPFKGIQCVGGCVEPDVKYCQTPR